MSIYVKALSDWGAVLLDGGNELHYHTIGVISGLPDEVPKGGKHLTSICCTAFFKGFLTKILYGCEYKAPKFESPLQDSVQFCQVVRLTRYEVLSWSCCWFVTSVFF